MHLRGARHAEAGPAGRRAGRHAEMVAIYEAHLAEPQAQFELAEALDIARERPSALLCYEADAAHCHRRIVAERLTRGLSVRGGGPEALAQ